MDGKESKGSMPVPAWPKPPTRLITNISNQSYSFFSRKLPAGARGPSFPTWLYSEPP